MKYFSGTTRYSERRCRPLAAAAWLAAALFALFEPAAAADRFFVLSYHDVRYDERGHVDDSQSTVSAANLAVQFQWLADHGYTPVSVSRILSAAAGGAPLPERAVLLTFDDGYRSFHDIVLPLLEEYDYPAVLALVTSWLEVPYGANVAYGSGYKPREDFLSWRQVRAVSRSPLVEIASHSHGLHKGVPGNPQGNSEPAATTRIYRDGGYERQQAYLDRVRDDLAASLRIIEDNTGWRPRVMVWPFGAHTRETRRIAAELGMRAMLTLETGVGRLDDLDRIPRLYISGNPDMRSFARIVHRDFEAPLIRRSIRISLDAIHAENLADTDENLGRVLDHVKELGINTAVVRAFHDADEDGVADAVYFPNRHLPMRADLLNRVVWQLGTRAGIRRIFAWMPSRFGRLGKTGTLEVFEDLGRHFGQVNIAGLLLEAPTDVLNEGDSAAIEEWLAEVREWHDAAGAATARLQLALAVRLGSRAIAGENIASHLGPLAGAADVHFLTLSRRAMQRVSDREEFAAFAGVGQLDRATLVDLVFEVPVRPGDTDLALEASRALLVAGVPSIGFFREDLSVDEAVVEGLRVPLSLRGHPYAP